MMEVFHLPSLDPPRDSAQAHASARIWLFSVAPWFGCQCISHLTAGMAARRRGDGGGGVGVGEGGL